MGKRRVEVSRLNFDVRCISTLESGRGFLMTDPAEVEINETKKKAMYGPQSPLYGTTFSDEQAFAERWRCECGDFKGEVFRGEICPHCGKPIEFRDADPMKIGWIPLGDHKIIAPHYYRILQQHIGKEDFTEMVYSKKKVDRDGHIVELSEDEKAEYQPRTPFYGIGIEEFRLRFEEIMNYFIKKKPNKADSLTRILNERLSVFTSFIPVYTTILRQQSVTSETFYFTGIDKAINTLVNLARNLREAEEEIDIPVILGRIQARVNSMWESNFELLNSKDGLIRDQLLGGAVREICCL